MCFDLVAHRETQISHRYFITRQFVKILTSQIET